MHCGLCTASCPTYVETCDENDSPRGRIYLMRAVADGRLEMGPGVRKHLELCLDCRALRDGLSVRGPVWPDDRAVQDRAPEVRPAGREDQPASAIDPPSLIPVSRAREAGAGAGPAAATHRAPRLGRAGRPDPALAAELAADAGDAPEAHVRLGATCRKSCRRSGRSGRGSPCSWAASPTRCSPRPTRPPPGSSSKTDARW